MLKSWLMIRFNWNLVASLITALGSSVSTLPLEAQDSSPRHLFAVGMLGGIQPPIRQFVLKGHDITITSGVMSMLSLEGAYRYRCGMRREHVIGFNIAGGFIRAHLNVDFSARTVLRENGEPLVVPQFRDRLIWSSIGPVGRWTLSYGRRLPCSDNGFWDLSVSGGVTEMTTTFAIGPILRDTTLYGQAVLDFNNGSTTMAAQVGVSVDRFLPFLKNGGGLLVGATVNLAAQTIAGDYLLFKGTQQEGYGLLRGSLSYASLRIAYCWTMVHKREPDCRE